MLNNSRQKNATLNKIFHYKMIVKFSQCSLRNNIIENIQTIKCIVTNKNIYRETNETIYIVYNILFCVCVCVLVCILYTMCILVNIFFTFYFNFL